MYAGFSFWCQPGADTIIARRHGNTMNISCEKCKSQFRIPDEKLSSTKSASFLCPKCKNRISVGPLKKKDQNGPDTAPEKNLHDEFDTETELDEYDASEKPFDFIEEEGKTALLCETDEQILQRVKNVLKLMEYHITIVKSDRDALKKIRYHKYDLILVNENFNTTDPDFNKVLIYLARQKMDLRRNIFVAMISHRFRTMDHMMALHKSVNMIINIKNIDDIGKILSRGITDTNLFFRLYTELLKETGRV